MKSGRMDVNGSKKWELNVAIASCRRVEMVCVARCRPPAIASRSLCLGWSKVRSHEKYDKMR